VEAIAQHRERVEIYFQLDGLNDSVNRDLRGEPLLDAKLAALEALGRAGVHVTLVATLQGGVNEDQLGPLVKFGIERPFVTGLGLQPATYSGRHVLPAQLEQRVTFPDIIKGIAAQTEGVFREDDFMPLPCAHPNCHSLTIAYRSAGQVVPISRFIDSRQNMDLLANGICFTRPQARNLILQYLGRQGCCGGQCGPEESSGANCETPNLVPTIGAPPTTTDGPGRSTSTADEFFARALAQQIGAENLFRITITSFLDAYNFDVRRVMKCCTHHVLPSGHVIPFCAYNVLYRNGHVPLPELGRTAARG